MKKLILILLLSLLSISCNKYIVQNVYEKTYPTEEIAVVDVFHQLNVYKLDSIPLNQWITNIMTADTIKVEQKIVRKTVSENSSYQLVYTKYTYPKSLSFKFLIRYSGKEKELIK